MVISSRTPEGHPNRCPICGCRLRLDPSWPSRDGPCPQCGHLLWFAEPSKWGAIESRAVVLYLVETRFGPVPPELHDDVMSLAERPDLKRVLERLRVVPSLTELLTELNNK